MPLLWVLECLDDVVDDLRVFHHERDPLSLPAPRFFGMAERLPLRGGAVTFALRQAAEAEQNPAAAAGTPIAEDLPDISELVGVSGPNSRGLPWIEYRNGS